ncbi:hypothetical protein [Leucobacter salsicius]|uniref:hypothetical protein n=1 Tax=Leucobacter salsicius TaxID=664638 RepID=UPI00068891F3|nr:hypothetical protein [Leucobacter salsicius]
MTTRRTPRQLERTLTQNLKHIRDHRRTQFGVGPGWFPLLGRLDHKLTQLAGTPEMYTYSQIKQKMGGLRCYTHISPDLPKEVRDQMDDAVTAAEKQSYETCEECSAPGVRRNPRGWVSTLCDECDAAREARRRRGQK